LAASDLRIQALSKKFSGEVPWRPSYSLAASAAVVAAIGVAVHITTLAVTAERELVQAARMAITISAQPDPASPRWNEAKTEMFTLLKDGVRINRHYRKLTPIAADEIARWGDWRDAIWVWESVLSSRPYVVAILTNIARGYIAIGQPIRAQEYLQRAEHLQPTARSVRSAEVLFYASVNQDAKALEIGRAALAQGEYDFDILNAMFVIGRRTGDFATAEKAMRLRLQGWDVQRAQGWMQLAEMLDRDMHEPVKAAQAYAQGNALARKERSNQTSASKG
jgi:hypothetical protein